MCSWRATVLRTCAPAASTGIITAEKGGYSWVAIVVSDFLTSARATGKAAGVPNLRVAVYPRDSPVHTN